MFKKTSITNRIIWIILAFFGWYILLGEILVLQMEKLLRSIFRNPSNALVFVNTYYAPLLASCVFFVLMCLIIKKDRFMLEIIKPTREKRSMSKLGTGILLGFLMNFFCIICALLHGDIKLYFDFSAAQIPLMIWAFVCVFFQSTSEELWCRCFMYERINVHYPLWVAIWCRCFMYERINVHYPLWVAMVVNGVVFGALHSFNDGITWLAMADLIICGLSFSLLRWYSGSIWTCFGIHTMWNFTQNFIFGLPNSGLISEASIFHMDAMNAVSNWCYSYEFGVEGAVPALLMDLMLGVVILVIASRQGRLGELLESRESKGELAMIGQKPVEAVDKEPEVEFEEPAAEKVKEEKTIEFTEEQ